MINQRKNNLSPIDFQNSEDDLDGFNAPETKTMNFESNEDSLDGFDFGEFEPR